MKTLVLVRHGKAAHRHGGEDIDRPLTHRGRADSEQMAEKFHELGVQVHAVLSSPALRAETTAKCFADWAVLPVGLDERLYDAGVPDLLDVVQGAEDFQETILLVGHNPGISEFLRVLLDRHHGDMPAASVAVINFDVPEWVDVVAGSGDLEWFMDPKILEAENETA
ncbi:SixA phosphatase family protein [Tichowtungia aerotolerans]|uniref:Histidine phosphatase family protein n=1 Tax=Tichowtungia aerotolerans TaxID=2697043 RepID=A0A6P1M6J1_9BACT|nr:histidine phosphatase family protein [Tichowtungia aerotolerans]QHI69471.1 histidine phosphatase family protein [Tichowtungia aerotolerans]